jgi:hypothetical protein
LQTIDFAVSPPSYTIKVEGSMTEPERERVCVTERERLRLFLPLDAIWRMQVSFDTVEGLF